MLATSMSLVVCACVIILSASAGLLVSFELTKPVAIFPSEYKQPIKLTKGEGQEVMIIR